MAGTIFSNHNNVNSRWSIAAIIGCFSIAILIFLLMPIYVGALADSYGFASEQLGILTSVEMLGQVVASLSAVYWVRKISWRRVVALCALILISINLLSAYVAGDYQKLLLLRCIAGLAGGAILAVGCALLGDTDQADRNFGFLVAAEVFLQGVLFATFPALMVEHGVQAFFLALAALAVLVLALSTLLPARGVEHLPESSSRQGQNRFPIQGLVATALFFVGILMVWSFVERAGVARGFTVERVGSALSISAFISIAGALSASALGDRLGRVFPMLIGLLGVLLSLGLLLLDMPYWSFLLAVSLMATFWNFWVPYQMGAVALVDSTGHYTVLIPLAQSLGAAAGPALAGQLMGDGNYQLIILVGAGFLIVCLGLFLPLLKHDYHQNNCLLPADGSGH